MPEFHIDYGTPEAARAYCALDSFTRGYIEAAFFTETSAPDDGDMYGASLAELAPATLAAMIEDCAAFEASIRKTWIKMVREHGEQDEERAGRDFWYTRNGHGCGFWDGRWPGSYGEALTAAVKAFHAVDIYRGDDEQIYLCQA